MTLASIASEVVELIAAFLEPSDLCSLRLACRDLSTKSHRVFASAHFECLTTDLTVKNLQRLQSVADCSHFSPFVRCLRVKQTEKEFEQRSRQPSGCVAQPQAAAETLYNLLSTRLLQCASIIFDTWTESEPSEDIFTPSDAIWLLLSIVAQANLRLYSITIQSQAYTSRRLNTPLLQLSSFQTPQFAKSWSQLESLVLDFDIQPDQWNWIRSLISSTQTLRKLSLDFFCEAPTIYLDPLPLTHLEELSLVRPIVKSDVLLSLLLNNRTTLRSLHIRDTTLDGHWPEVFQRMTGCFPHLHKLDVFDLRSGNVKGCFGFTNITRHPSAISPVTRDDKRFVKLYICRIGQEEVVCSSWDIKDSAVGVNYHGKAIDRILDVLAEG